MIERIAHPTDLSKTSRSAFIHALRLALAAKCSLDLLHVKQSGSREDWHSFPHVREALAQWGIMDADAPPSEIARRAGIQVRKAEIEHPDGPSAGVFSYIARHPTGLIVTAPHQQGILSRWSSGSVSQDIALKTHRPTLFLGDGMTHFVDEATGDLRLRTILVPVDHHPSPIRVIDRLGYFFASFGLAPRFELIHVGKDAPEVPGSESDAMPVTCLEGAIVPTIVEHAKKCGADLIAMPTAGHDGFLDMLRGSTTERVMRETTVPLLAIPT
jgi:nucleotide-binding universal stress UspA family protein